LQTKPTIFINQQYIKMKIVNLSIFILCTLLFSACTPTPPDTPAVFVDKQFKNADAQLSLLLTDALAVNRNPRTVDAEGEYHWVRQGFDWTEGFFPGTSWFLYDITKNDKWKASAEKFQASYEDHKNFTGFHDLGFIFNCSYGNGYKITKTEAYKEVLKTASDSLITRFNPTVGSIISWDVDRGWQSKRGWKFPVIIDNMMNLEMLFEASLITGDSKYKEVAIAHANTTLKNHFRDDYSSFHVVDYDPETGAVRSKQTAQGFADSSAWARGQAWAIYGYTMCYRYTQDEKYLEQAQKVADYIINYPGLPADFIPYWDYNDTKIPNAPRDASAAAITASALVELSGYTNGKYIQNADDILKSLASPEYTAAIGTNKNFILKHSVGSIPHNNEIDVPLNYADYYYLEALLKFKQYHTKK